MARYVQHISERFYRKVKDRNGCCEWIGSITTNGYGQFWLQGRMQQAHRVAWEWLNGPIPAMLQLDHLCRNRRCVNVTHLRLVTNRQNQLADGSLGAANHNWRRWHCAKGHLFTDENTIYVRGHIRICRTCRNEIQRLGDKRRREQKKCLDMSLI